MQKDKIKITFPSKSQNEAFARSSASAFALRFEPTFDELNDVKGAVSEAVTNAIVHGYPDCVGIVEMNLWSGENNTLYIRVSDKGVGISDIKKAMEPLYTSSSSGERAGLGFAVMENFCDRITVKSQPGKGTSVTLVKKIKAKI